MVVHPYRAVAIAGGFNTKQARYLDADDDVSIAVEAVKGALDCTGANLEDVDMLLGFNALRVMQSLGIGPIRGGRSVETGIAAVMDAVNAVAAGVANVAVVAGGRAGGRTEAASTAMYTRPENEFIGVFGLYTAVEFALNARRHMDLYGTTVEQFAAVAAAIRNNGTVNPEAVHFGRGPYSVSDILASPMIADPFHLLDCAIVSEGGAALVITTVDRARDLRLAPVAVLGIGCDVIAAPYEIPPAWDFRPQRSGGAPNGYIGRNASRRAFAMAGLSPRDVDCCEFYDPFSFEIIRQYEAFEFCGEGEGGAFVMAGLAAAEQKSSITTDGGTLSYSHTGVAQELQRVIRAVHQLQGICLSRQLEAVDIVMCSNGGAGAMYCDVAIVGRH